MDNEYKLEEIYYNPKDPGSYGGVERLYRRAASDKVPLSREAIKHFLSQQRAYSLHKPVRKQFVRNKTFVGGIDKQWQADLADMQRISKHNDGVKYLLTVIDVFSKYAWAVPVKQKSAAAVTEAFKRLFRRETERRPERLQTDKGKEFLNKNVQELLKQLGIKHFWSSSDQKAAIAERFNRTLKTRIWTWLSAQQQSRYIDNLQDFLNSYNNSFHRSIGMPPADVRKNTKIKYGSACMMEMVALQLKKAFQLGRKFE